MRLSRVRWRFEGRMPETSGAEWYRLGADPWERKMGELLEVEVPKERGERGGDRKETSREDRGDDWDDENEEDESVDRTVRSRSRWIMSCFLRGRADGLGRFGLLRVTEPQEEEMLFSSIRILSRFSFDLNIVSSSSSDILVSHVLSSVTLKDDKNCCMRLMTSALPFGSLENEGAEDEEEENGECGV